MLLESSFPFFSFVAMPAFGLTTMVTGENFLRRSRVKNARKLSNSRIEKIHFHLMRNWFGTMEYHKHPDMDLVWRLLGHKSIRDVIKQPLY
ncbi:MAG: hypothetical protein NWE84_07935 [Candidatus Bathyarchaeota archaeon]|nr:hypothetical protein [Candidatus Bathyarchaeota archaeon]